MQGTVGLIIEKSYIGLPNSAIFIAFEYRSFWRWYPGFESLTMDNTSISTVQYMSLQRLSSCFD